MSEFKLQSPLLQIFWVETTYAFSQKFKLQMCGLYSISPISTFSLFQTVSVFAEIELLVRIQEKYNPFKVNAVAENIQTVLSSLKHI